MIQGVGYTQDGMVWINLLMEINGQKLTGTLTMEEGFSRQVAGDIVTAADKAREAVRKGVVNE